jgi:hypothetical protein
MRRSAYVALTEVITDVYTILFGHPEAKRSLGRSSNVWEDGMKIDLKKARAEGVTKIELASNRVQ